MVIVNSGDKINEIADRISTTLGANKSQQSLILAALELAHQIGKRDAMRECINAASTSVRHD